MPLGPTISAAETSKAERFSGMGRACLVYFRKGSLLDRCGPLDYPPLTHFPAD